MAILDIDKASLRSAFLAAQRQAERMDGPPDRWDDPAAAAERGTGNVRRGRRAALVAALLLVVLAACVTVALFLQEPGSSDPLPAQALAATEVPVAAPERQPQVAETAAAAIAAATPAAIAEPVRDGIALVRGRVEFDLSNADARTVLPRLAALTGANLSGLEALSGGDARITLQGTRASGRESWQAVLEGINSILSCSSRSCDVWILPSSRHGVDAVLAPTGAMPAVPSPDDESTPPEPAPARVLAPGRATPAVPSSEDSADN